MFGPDLWSILVSWMVAACGYMHTVQTYSCCSWLLICAVVKVVNKIFMARWLCSVHTSWLMCHGLQFEWLSSGEDDIIHVVNIRMDVFTVKFLWTLSWQNTIFSIPMIDDLSISQKPVFEVAINMLGALHSSNCRHCWVQFWSHMFIDFSWNCPFMRQSWCDI